MRIVRAFLAGAVACSAGAYTLDQVSPYTNTSYNMFSPGLHWQQEVVAGLAGPLVQVDLYVTQAGSCTFFINDGAPWQGDPPNWTTTFTATTTGWVSVNTAAAGVFFNPGDHFVLGFDTLGVGVLNLGGSWQPPAGGYPPGQLYINGGIQGDGAYDIAFRTYVPEPAGLACGGLSALFLRRRR